MHPLLPFGVGALLGVAGWAVATAGARERYERIALAVGVLLGLGAGAAIYAAAWPPTPGFGKRWLCTAGLGLAAPLLGCNLGIVAQAGSGGFSSARTNSMIAVAAFAVLLALCLPGARPS